MAINFSGLATGMDTGSLIKSLMELERKPISRLNSDKAYQQNRVAALGEFNATLKSLQSSAEKLGSATALKSWKATTRTNEFFSAKAADGATPGNYQIVVDKLAQVEKNVSEVISGGGRWLDKDAKAFKTGPLTLNIGGVQKASLTIDGSNNSLSGIAKAINDAKAGVAATIIHDGSQYRLVLTGDSVTQANIQLDASGMIEGAGSYANPNFAVYSGGSGLPEHADGTAASVQHAQKAKIIVDGIAIESDTNTFSEAIPGVTLTVDKADPAVSTTLAVEQDFEATKKLINDLVSSYNKVMAFVGNQSKNGEDDKAGILIGDSGVSSIARRLRGLLTEPAGGGTLTLSQLGLATQKDGTLKQSSVDLTKALEKDFEGVVGLLAGTDGQPGIAAKMKGYLAELTHTTDGFFAGRKASVDANVKRIDRDILRSEVRILKRQKALEAQFTAMEKMVSTLNGTGDYLNKQMDMLENLWRRN